MSRLATRRNHEMFSDRDRASIRSPKICIGSRTSTKFDTIDLTSPFNSSNPPLYPAIGA